MMVLLLPPLVSVIVCRPSVRPASVISRIFMPDWFAVVVTRTDCCAFALARTSFICAYGFGADAPAGSARGPSMIATAATGASRRTFIEVLDWWSLRSSDGAVSIVGDCLDATVGRHEDVIQREKPPERA